MLKYRAKHKRKKSETDPTPSDPEAVRFGECIIHSVEVSLVLAMLFTMVLSTQGRGGKLWIMTGSEREHISKYMGIRAYLQRYICVAL